MRRDVLQLDEKKSTFFGFFLVFVLLFLLGLFILVLVVRSRWFLVSDGLGLGVLLEEVIEALWLGGIGVGADPQGRSGGSDRIHPVGEKLGELQALGNSYHIAKCGKNSSVAAF